MRSGHHSMFVSFLLATGALLLVALGIALGKDADWWSAWGQWVGGLGSIAAAITAIWIAVEGWRRSDGETARIRKREEQELASKVGVWVDKNLTTDSDRMEFNEMRQFFPRTTDGIDAGWYSIKVSNRGSLPVYDVQINVQFFSSPVDGERNIGWYSYRKPIFGPTDNAVSFELEKFAFHLRLMRAVEKVREGRATTTHGSVANQIADLTPDLDYWHIVDHARIVVSFTDANNVSWARNIPGELRRQN